MNIILASTSRYRAALLERLGIPFETAAPDIDESGLPGESAPEIAKRLAREKALAVAPRFDSALVIGCDQTVSLGEEVLGKPLTAARARAQLRRLSDQQAVFHSAIAVVNTETGAVEEDIIPYRVTFRALTDNQIADYVARDRPLDCAGALKSEALGIALIRSMEGSDPNALIGLPLIRLVDMLEQQGYSVLGS